jgi:hypothetical protein
VVVGRGFLSWKLKKNLLSPSVGTTNLFFGFLFVPPPPPPSLLVVPYTGTVSWYHLHLHIVFLQSAVPVGRVPVVGGARE